MKILVIQQKMIGDVLATSIVCNNLKSIYPNARVDYLVYPFTKAAIENNPNIDTIILFEDDFRKSKKALFRFLISIREAHYDMVIDAYGKFESNVVVLFSGAASRIGFYKPYTRFLYTKSVKPLLSPKTSAGLALENRLNLINFLKPEIQLDIKPKIFLTRSEIENGRQILESAGVDFTKKIYMIGVLGSGTDKTYPFAFMAQIIDFIVGNTDATLLFNYMPSQRADAETVYGLCLQNTQKHVRIDITAESIRDFLSLTYHCNALIGNEGGAVNMAKAIGIPTFTIFSPWIRKEAWNSFENGTDTVSVHLNDFRPALYHGKQPKEMKAESLRLYGHFTPELIKPVLKKYLEDN